jgi:DNA-binding NarL/FixJ family response regulator
MSDHSFLPSLSGATILLIDPHKEDREYWAQCLTIASQDCVVLEADSGAAGLAICRWQRVDCVLVELSLPDMSGFRVVIELVPRARRPEIAVIILTRLALSPMGDLALKNGAQGYLVKSQISGDVLNMNIYEAINRVPRRECSFGERH